MGTFTAHEGDTLYSIALAHGISIEALLRFNPGADPLRPQGSIVIPEPGGYYTVSAGDSIASIAKRWRTDAASIKNANPFLFGNTLIIGQTLRLPERAPVR